MLRVPRRREEAALGVEEKAEDPSFHGVTYDGSVGNVLRDPGSWGLRKWTLIGAS